MRYNTTIIGGSTNVRQNIMEHMRPIRDLRQIHGGIGKAECDKNNDDKDDGESDEDD